MKLKLAAPATDDLAEELARLKGEPALEK